MKYHTAEGIECSLLQLCKTEPEWAANRIAELQRISDTPLLSEVPSDLQVSEWAERYDIQGTLSELRTMVEDAMTIMYK